VLHIDDLVDAYVRVLTAPKELLGDVVFNVASESRTTLDHARVVQRELPAELDIAATGDGDHRSYEVSSDRLSLALGYQPRRTVRDAARDLAARFGAGDFGDALTADAYYNLRVQKRIGW
jgi:nucleoside-diphosphate-sugar epimerase